MPAQSRQLAAIMFSDGYLEIEKSLLISTLEHSVLLKKLLCLLTASRTPLKQHLILQERKRV